MPKSNKVARVTPTPRKAPRVDMKTRRDAPAARGHKSVTRRPRWRIDGERFHIMHREYISTVQSDSDNVFSYDAYPIDVANPASFPWLAGIAQNFEDFRLEAFSAEVVPECGSNQTGSIILSIDFDAHDPNTAETKQSLMQIEDAVQAPIWEGVRYDASKKNLSKISKDRYVGSTQPTIDQSRLTSFGTLYCATTPTTVTAAVVPPYPVLTLGDLYFDYHVSFSTPQHNGSLFRSDTAIPTAPQLYRNADTSSALGSASNDPLRGIPDSVGFQNGIVDVQAFGAKVVTALANQYIDPNTGNFCNAGQKVLKFDRDVEANLSIMIANASGTTPGWTTAPSQTNIFTQFVEAVPNANATGYVPSASAPDVSENAINLAYASNPTTTGTAVVDWLYRISVAAGTVLKLYNSVAFLTNGGSMRSRIVMDSHKFSASDLDEMRQNNLLEEFHDVGQSASTSTSAPAPRARLNNLKR